ncbi:MAG: MFS transporter [Pirellulaceae bacterium]|nr:MFS transporter [Pirellulaceae bacterium]
MALAEPLAPPELNRTGSPPAADAGKWMALAAALLGWMFDGAEMGVFSLVGGKAMEALMPGVVKGDRDMWFNIIMASFLVGAATGGVLFGWLGDRIGRVRAMTLSVLTYALFTGLCGFAGAAWQIGVLRFIASLGMGGEWSLGVALVMEVWPNKSRAFMAGLIGAAANVGYLLVGFVGLVLLDWLESVRQTLLQVGTSPETAESLVGFSGWRLMMILGTLPALLTFFIRIFVPESEKWKKEQGTGNTSMWATQDLLAVLIGLAGPALIVAVWGWPVKEPSATWTAVQILATLVGLAIATAGYTYPVIRYFQRHAAVGGEQNWKPTLNRMLLAACLAGVALLGTWGTTQQAPTWASDVAEADHKAKLAAIDAPPGFVLPKPKAKEHTLIWLSVGAIVGTILAAFAGDWLGRRPAYFVLCCLSMASVWMLYLGNTTYGSGLLFWAFVAGTCTASFYGWLPLYLPELFSTNVRATGQGFGFNFGRILAAVGVLQVGNLLKIFTEDWHLAGWTLPHGRPLACSIIALVYLIGMILIWFAPETHGKPLPE